MIRASRLLRPKFILSI